MVLKENAIKYFDYDSISLWRNLSKIRYSITSLYEIQNGLKIHSLPPCVYYNLDFYQFSEFW